MNEETPKPKKLMFLKLLTLIFSFVFFIGISIFCGIIYLDKYNKDKIKVESVSILIPKGSSLKKISNILYENNVIENPELFFWINRYNKQSALMKAGDYEFEGFLSPIEVTKKLVDGDTVKYSITIAEGLTSKQIIDLLNKSPLLSGEVTEKVKEGEILPETYIFSKNHSRDNLISDMKKAMLDTLKTAWENKSDNLSIKNIQEALILASIIEKETGINGERRRVSAVFHNRLKINMPLQTDPTVIYAITKGKYKLDRPLYYKDLKIDSPYNTYKIKGLPPTAIANPGKAAIEAAVNPIESDELYFVADGTGGHQFAKNLKGHLKNVKKWREIQKKLK